MFNDNKHVFWQALVMALVLFWTGILLGIMFEQSRADKLKVFYFASETDIFDIQTGQELLVGSNLSCDFIAEQNIYFVDKIFNEAKVLEKYDASSKLTEDVSQLHRRYDLLRIMVLKNILNSQKSCRQTFNVVIYFYQYTNPSVNTQAVQTTFSKLLIDMKKKYGDEVILIPIAYDTDLQSVGVIKEQYNLTQFPVVLINGKYKITELMTLEDLEKYLWI